MICFSFMQFINFYVLFYQKFYVMQFAAWWNLNRFFCTVLIFFPNVLTWIPSKQSRYAYTYHDNKYSLMTQKYIVNTFPCIHKFGLFSSMLSLHAPLWEACPQQSAIYSVCGNQQPICTAPAEQGKGSQPFTPPRPAMSQSSAGQEPGEPSLSLIVSFQVLFWFEKSQRFD